jgi:hypothetical protein
MNHNNTDLNQYLTSLTSELFGYMRDMTLRRVFQVGYLGIRLGGFTRRWQMGGGSVSFSLKLMRGKDLIKKHEKAPPFLRARAD